MAPARKPVKKAAKAQKAVKRTELKACDGVHHPPNAKLGGLCMACGQTVGK